MSLYVYLLEHWLLEVVSYKSSGLSGRAEVDRLPQAIALLLRESWARVYVRPTEASAVGWVPQLERFVVRPPHKVGTDQSGSSGTR